MSILAPIPIYNLLVLIDAAKRAFERDTGTPAARVRIHPSMKLPKQLKDGNKIHGLKVVRDKACTPGRIIMEGKAQ